MKVDKDFFALDTTSIAKGLLGQTLVTTFNNQLTSGKIVETEAYINNDIASHAFKGQTSRNYAMFMEPGTIYIYRIYGMYLCLNIVTAPKGIGEAVLIRALEPLEGIQVMEQRRGIADIYKLSSGPARLVQALGISFKDNGTNLFKGPVQIEKSSFVHKEDIVTTPRIGIAKGVELPLRFFIKGNPFVSKP